MARSQRRLLVIIGAIFLGLYLLNNNFFFSGHWFYLGHVWWLKWLVLGLGLWIIIGCFSSSQPRRRHQYRDDYQRRSNREILDRIDCLQAELAELRQRRENTSRHARGSELDRKLSDLTERIENLEKIVTDRRYRLDDELDKL